MPVNRSRKNRDRANKNRVSNILNPYFEQLKRYKLLDHEQEIALSKRIQQGDKEASQTLIKSNLLLVVKIARHYSSSEFDLQEYIQEGNLGLLRAAALFDYRHNVRFSTYATWSIKQSILNAINRKIPHIRLPERKINLIKQIQQTKVTLTQQLGRKPSSSELAQNLGLDSSTIHQTMRNQMRVMSLEENTNADNTVIYDILADSRYQPDRALIRKSMQQNIHKALADLSERERKILRYRFAFYGHNFTLKEIGEKLLISSETVRQIEQRAIKKLRNHFHYAE